ncbi:hypothetical protein QJQ45_014228 [Haematococcus lacustris]|nr:hypothetical protein QJQ45_014228 [Haematococcus lacustris]
MVQLAPNLTLCLKHLAAHGAVVSAEQQVVAALDHSLPIKRTEAGLKTLVLWGRLTAVNGKDYLIAEGYNAPLYKDGAVLFESKYYYSQDGVKWIDLVAVDTQTASIAERIKAALSGDPSKIHELVEKDPNPPPPNPDEEAEPPKPLVYTLTELALLRQRIDSIAATTGVIPVHCMLPDARNQLVTNHHFAGVSYPDKLESYQHRTDAPGGPTLAKDLRGSWTLHYDPFKCIATCRSLIYPGYTFYYHAHELTWGALYLGDGVRNDDLIFML